MTKQEQSKGGKAGLLLLLLSRLYRTARVQEDMR